MRVTLAAAPDAANRRAHAARRRGLPALQRRGLPRAGEPPFTDPGDGDRRGEGPGGGGARLGPAPTRASRARHGRGRRRGGDGAARRPPRRRARPPDLAGALERGGLWWFLILFLGGLALNLTPCVFPMIGVTVSVFGARRRERTVQDAGPRHRLRAGHRRHLLGARRGRGAHRRPVRRRAAERLGERRARRAVRRAVAVDVRPLRDAAAGVGAAAPRRRRRHLAGRHPPVGAGGGHHRRALRRAVRRRRAGGAGAARRRAVRLPDHVRHVAGPGAAVPVPGAVLEPDPGPAALGRLDAVGEEGLRRPAGRASASTTCWSGWRRVTRPVGAPAALALGGVLPRLRGPARLGEAGVPLVQARRRERGAAGRHPGGDRAARRGHPLRALRRGRGRRPRWRRAAR